jgi:hypothetical protein
MSDDMDRARHLARMSQHYEKLRQEALDDNGRKDASRQGVKAAQEIARLRGGAKPK